MKGKEKEGSKGSDGWIAPPIQWTTDLGTLREVARDGRPGMLRSVGLQRVRRNLATEKQQHVYMKSRKMVQMSCTITGQEYSPRHGEQTCGHGGKKRVG